MASSTSAYSLRASVNWFARLFGAEPFLASQVESGDLERLHPTVVSRGEPWLPEDLDAS